MDAELELANYMDFEKGFSNWHVTWPFSEMVTAGAKTKIKSCFDTSIQFPGNCRKLSLLWQMEIDNDTGDETRWVGISCLGSGSSLGSKLDNPVPVLYRMVLLNQKNVVRHQWSCFKIFELPFSKSGWQNFCTAAEIAMVKESDLSLHLFLSIPFAACKIRPMNGSVPKPMFSIDEISDPAEDFVRGLAKLFDMVLGEANGDDVFDGKGESDDPYDCLVSDITFVMVNDNQVVRRFNCHRTILAMRSPYFMRQFRRRRSTSTSTSTSRLSVSGMPTIPEEDVDGEIKIDDVDAAAMEDALRFIYTGCVPLFDNDDREENNRKYINIAMAAEKFELDALKTYCLSRLLFVHYDDNARIDQLAAIGKSNSMNQLKAVCLEQLAISAISRGKDMMVEFFLHDRFAEVLKMALQKFMRFNQTTAPPYEVAPLLDSN